MQLSSRPLVQVGSEQVETERVQLSSRLLVQLGSELLGPLGQLEQWLGHEPGELVQRSGGRELGPRWR